MGAVKTKFSLVTLSLILSACGGGGGGGGGTLPTFTSWSAIQPDSTVVISGLSSEASYTFDAGGLTGISNPSAVPDAFTATASYDEAGDLTKLVLKSPTSTVGFNLNDGDLIAEAPDYIAAINSEVTEVALMANPGTRGWDYQSYGVWQTFTNTLPGSGTVGVFSAGAPTAGTAIPQSGGATFTGDALGLYVDAAGQDYLTSANLTVNADFLNRELGFNTTDTIDYNTLGSLSNLNLSGTLTYLPGTNSFSGPVTSAGGLSGGSTGQFYGPGAEELGGVFFLKGAGLETFGGAYGARR